MSAAEQPLMTVASGWSVQLSTNEDHYCQRQRPDYEQILLPASAAARRIEAIIAASMCVFRRKTVELTVTFVT